jgi:hypothetical protein
MKELGYFQLPGNVYMGPSIILLKHEVMVAWHEKWA